MDGMLTTLLHSQHAIALPGMQQGGERALPETTAAVSIRQMPVPHRWVLMPLSCISMMWPCLALP